MPTVKLIDIVMEYEEYGSGSPLLMLHGSGASWRMYEPQLESLGKHYRLIMPHMRGHGGSSPLPPVEYYHPLMADDTRLFMDAMGLKGVPVYGESMGAVVALLLAIRHPGYASRLIPVCGYSEIPGADAQWLLTLSNAIFSLFSMNSILSMMMAAAYPLKEEGSALTRQVLRNSLAIDKRTFVQLKTSKFPRFTADLASITVPTLVMGGTGLSFEERGSRTIFEQIPGAHLTLFAGGKDPLSTTRQRAHDALVLDFLSGGPLGRYDGVTLFGKER